MSATQKLMSFHVVERMRTAINCTNMEKACVRAKRAKLQFVIIKYANLSSLSVMPQKSAIPRNIRLPFPESVLALTNYKAKNQTGVSPYLVRKIYTSEVFIVQFCSDMNVF